MKNILPVFKEDRHTYTYCMGWVNYLRDLHLLVLFMEERTCSNKLECKVEFDEEGKVCGVILEGETAKCKKVFFF